MNKIDYYNKYIKYKTKFLEQKGGTLNNIIDIIKSLIQQILINICHNLYDNPLITAKYNDFSVLQLNLSMKKIIKLQFSIFVYDIHYELLYLFYLFNYYKNLKDYKIIKDKQTFLTIIKDNIDELLIEYYGNNKLLVNLNTSDIYENRLIEINKLYFIKDKPNIIFLQEFDMSKEKLFNEYKFYFNEISVESAVIGVLINDKKFPILIDITYLNKNSYYFDVNLFKYLLYLCNNNLKKFTIIKIDDTYYVSLHAYYNYTNTKYKFFKFISSMANFGIKFIISGDFNILQTDYKLWKKLFNSNLTIIDIKTEEIKTFQKYCKSIKQQEACKYIVDKLISFNISINKPQLTVDLIIYPKSFIKK